MSSKFSDEFKWDAVAQITVRGYPVGEVSDRLGVSPYPKRKYARNGMLWALEFERQQKPRQEGV